MDELTHLEQRALRARLRGDALRNTTPGQAARAYGECAELLLARCLLVAAREEAARSPLRALTLLRRVEELAGTLRAAWPVAAAAYLALGEEEVASSFLARALAERAPGALLRQRPLALAAG